MTEIDPVQYGRLLESVDHLTDVTDELAAQVKALAARLEEVDGRFKIGKGTLFGLILALGGSAYGLKELVATLFGRHG
jgi:hypothetical protein